MISRRHALATAAAATTSFLAGCPGAVEPRAQVSIEDHWAEWTAWGNLHVHARLRNDGPRTRVTLRGECDIDGGPTLTDRVIWTVAAETTTTATLRFDIPADDLLTGVGGRYRVWISDMEVLG